MYYLFNQNNLASNNINKINWPSLTQKKDLIKSNYPPAEPYTVGTNESDNFVLGAAEKGTILGNAGDDTFDYQDELGSQNTRLVGGQGNDTLAFSKLTFEQALDSLQKNGYSFVARQNGFILRTKDNQEIQISAENIKFSDKCFNLQNNSPEIQTFIDALRSKCIPILDETYKPVFTEYNNSTNSFASNKHFNLQKAYYESLGHYNTALNQLNPNQSINKTNLNGLTLNSLTSADENINSTVNPSLRANNIDLSNSINTSNTFNFVGFSPNQLGGLTGNDPYWLLNASS